MKVYVASSWRNNGQPLVVKALCEAGHEVYDFKNPEEDHHGFHWSDVGMSSYDRETNGPVPLEEYRAGIEHPIAIEGFSRDFDAMQWADACVLVLDCGRSAHLELGWFVGQGKPTCILFTNPDEVVPELMYRMVGGLAGTIDEAVGWVTQHDKAQWPQDLRVAINILMADATKSMSAVMVREAMSERWPGAWPLVSWLDIHDEMTAMYGSAGEGS